MTYCGYPTTTRELQCAFTFSSALLLEVYTMQGLFGGTIRVDKDQRKDETGHEVHGKRWIPFGLLMVEAALKKPTRS
jgi:hypothetical protein